MTLGYFAGRRISGTATDRTGGTWTNLTAGWIFIETDTGSLYYWNGTSWVASLPASTPAGVFPSKAPKRKYGTWQGTGTTSNNDATGLIFSISPVAGHTDASVKDTTLGVGRKYTTTTTITTNAGWKMNTSYTLGGLNPSYRALFRLGTTTLQRLYIGFHTSGADLTGDDPLNAQAGVMLGMRSADTVFQIMHNDTTGATVFESTGVTIDTNVHKIEIIGDIANSRYGWSLDGSAFSYTNLSTDIPSSGTTLVFQNEIQTNESGVAKILDLALVEVECDSKW